MSSPVIFDFAVFSARYGEWAYLDPATAQEYFNEATIYWRNDGTSPNATTAVQTSLLNMLTAHIAQLYAPRLDGQAAPQTVGRISDASEGSVSVSLQNDYEPGTAQWFEQTKYGASFWQATNAYRRFRYAPRCRPLAGWSGPAWLYPRNRF